MTERPPCSKCRADFDSKSTGTYYAFSGCQHWFHTACVSDKPAGCVVCMAISGDFSAAPAAAERQIVMPHAADADIYLVREEPLPPRGTKVAFNKHPRAWFLWSKPTVKELRDRKVTRRMLEDVGVTEEEWIAQGKKVEDWKSL